VKLRGRATTPDGAEGAQFTGARGAKRTTHHGPLQRLLEATLAIDFAAVTDHGNLNQRPCVVHSVNNAPIPDSNSPEVIGALEFLTTGRSRLSPQSFDALKNSASNAAVKRLQLFPSRAREEDRVFTHGFCVSHCAAAGA
jgi:hypothetical protein